MSESEARAALRDLPAASSLPPFRSRPGERDVFIADFCEAFEAFARRHTRYHETHGQDVHDFAFVMILGDLVSDLSELDPPPEDEAFVAGIVDRFALAFRISEIAAAVLEGGDKTLSDEISERGVRAERPVGPALERYGVEFDKTASGGCV